MNEAPVFGMMDNVRTFHKRCRDKMDAELKETKPWSAVMGTSNDMINEGMLKRWQEYNEEKQLEDLELRILRSSDADFNDRVWKLEMFARNIPIPMGLLQS